MKPILWIDTETTGVTQERDQVLQLAGMIEINGVIVESFNYWVKPTDLGLISKGATAVNGITKEIASTYRDPREVVVEFRELLEKWLPATKKKYNMKKDKYILAGYNTNFDAGMLNHFFALHSRKPFVQYTGFIKIDVYQRVQDLMIERDWYWDLPKHGLSYICEVNDVDLGNKAHDAMYDIHATRELYLKLKEK